MNAIEPNFISLWQLWLVACIVLFILEIFTSGFLLACFGVGALAGTLAALLGLPLVWQVIIFSVVTVLSLVFIRPFILKISKNKETPSGMDALIGRVVRVYEDISPRENTGSVSCDGDIWKAITIDNTCIEKGELVEIVSYDSLVVTVQRVSK